MAFEPATAANSGPMGLSFNTPADVIGGCHREPPTGSGNAPPLPRSACGDPARLAAANAKAQADQRLGG